MSVEGLNNDPSQSEFEAGPVSPSAEVSSHVEQADSAIGENAAAETSIESSVDTALKTPLTRRNLIKHAGRGAAALAVGGVASSALAQGAGAQETSAETGESVEETTENIVLGGEVQVSPEAAEAAEQAWKELESQGRIEDVSADLWAVNDAYSENPRSGTYDPTPPEEALRLEKIIDQQGGHHYRLDYVFKSQPPQMDIHVEAYAIYPLETDGAAPEARAVLLQVGQERVDLKDEPELTKVLDGRGFSYIRALMSDGTETWVAVATNDRNSAISEKIEEDTELNDQRPMTINTLEDVGEPAQPQVAPKGAEGFQPELVAKPETVMDHPDMLPHTEPSSVGEPVTVDTGERMGSYEPARTPLEEPRPDNPNLGFEVPETSSTSVESSTIAPPAEVAPNPAQPAPASPNIGFMPPEQDHSTQASPTPSAETASQGNGRSIGATDAAAGLAAAGLLAYDLKNKDGLVRKQVPTGIRGLLSRFSRRNDPEKPKQESSQPEMGRP